MNRHTPSGSSAARSNEPALSEADDIEMSFIRTLSVGGLVLSGPISAESRRERIRIAIFDQRLPAAPFNEHMSFEQAYQRCYNRSLELRRVDRDARQRPVDQAVPDDEDASFDEDEALGLDG